MVEGSSLEKKKGGQGCFFFFFEMKRLACDNLKSQGDYYLQKVGAGGNSNLIYCWNKISSWSSFVIYCGQLWALNQEDEELGTRRQNGRRCIASGMILTRIDCRLAWSRLVFCEPKFFPQRHFQRRVNSSQGQGSSLNKVVPTRVSGNLGVLIYNVSSPARAKGLMA